LIYAQKKFLCCDQIFI